MTPHRYPLLTLTLLLMTLTLTLACHFDRQRFVCNPFQRGVCGGTCVIKPRLGCVCQLRSYDQYYGVGPGRYFGGRGRRPYVDPEKMRKDMHPFSDKNMERSYDMIGHLAKLDRIIS